MKSKTQYLFSDSLRARIGNAYSLAVTLTSLLTVASLVLTLVVTTGCTVRTPSTEVPVPTDRGVEKTFFRDIVAKPDGKVEIKPKTFLCGWAPISETGAVASALMTHAVHMSGHCNMEFEITEDNLVGRLVNPSFPNDRKRWRQALTIPIRKHYYYEKAKDSYGRETNEYIENTNRSDPSARPMMQLGLEGVSIKDWDLSMFYDSRNGNVVAIEDVEWDKANNFLGFTAVLQNFEWGAQVGARIRFNFKAFDHNENFEKTPYSTLNSKYFNALHVIGEKVEGVTQVWSAAKWDLSKTHDVYLHGFPEAYVPIAQRVIEDWNDALEKIGRPRAFKLNLKPMKYPYDLRYPMLVWVDDPLISESSPLGVGMAQADVRNGEIIWGQITLYGGYLEQYVKMHMASNSAGSVAGAAGGVSGGAAGAAAGGSSSGLSFYTSSRYFNPSLTSSAANPAGSTSQMVMNLLTQNGRRAFSVSPEQFEALGMSSDSLIESGMKSLLPGKSAKGLSAAEVNRAKSVGAAALSAKLNAGYADAARDIQSRLSSLESSGLRAEDLRFNFGFPSVSAPPIRRQYLAGKDGALSVRERETALYYQDRDRMLSMSNSVVQDVDRRLGDVGPALVAAIGATRMDYDTALRKVILNLVAHEYGHFLGLGHQFKENILPEDGTVPQKYLTELKRLAKKDMTNTTSLMGYPHPMTEILEEESSIVAGPQDLLTLRYLYNGEYATFRRGSDDADFTFVKVPKSGVIPAMNPDKPEYVTSYFPQCNDFDATFSADPYCNRFDRGFDAETIVKSYFDDLNTNMVSRLYAFTDVRGANTDAAENYLWWRALTNMGRVRVFYDHMRQKYAEEIALISQSQTDLYDFAAACSGEKPGSKRLQDIFEKNPGLKSLCKVNRYAIEEMKRLIAHPGPDNSRMDWDNANVAAGFAGGDASSDYTRVWGTHTALSVLPLKLAAMNALTTPYPYTMLGGMWPIARYSGADGKFSYSSLYPYEFTQAVALAAKKSLKFGSAENPIPTMGRPFFSLGYFLDAQSYSNEASRFPKDYVESIRRQSTFRFSMKAIILTFITRDQKERVVQMKAELYDPYTDKVMEMPGGAFLLPRAKIIVRPPARNFVYPVSTLKFLNSTTAFVWAYHIEYEKAGGDDVLETHGIRTALESVHREVVDQCIDGKNGNGLSSFFNMQKEKEKFPGFLVLQNIETNEDHYELFLESIRANFKLFLDEYKNTPEPPTEARCERALLGQGLVVSSAALLQGYFLPEAWDALVK